VLRNSPTLAALLICLATAIAQAGPAALSAEECAVLGALISAEAHLRGSEHVVVLNRTSAPRFMGRAGSEWTGAGEGTWSDLQAKINDSVPVEPRVQAPLTASVVSSAELQAMEQSGEFSREAFQERYPGARGVLTFSRVGINAAGDEALATVVYQDGERSEVFLARLVKRAGIWRLASETPLWAL
jgi:hypothetical protein